MTLTLEFRQNSSTGAQIEEHLLRCDRQFVPPLSVRGQIDAYAQKLASHADRFEAWSEGELVGLVAAYCNDRVTHQGFITNVSTLPGWMGHGIGTQLVVRCLDHARGVGMFTMRLEVAATNTRALNLYSRLGFTTVTSSDGGQIQMSAILAQTAP